MTKCWINKVGDESDNHILVTKGINVDVKKSAKMWQPGIINLQMTAFSKSKKEGSVHYTLALIVKIFTRVSLNIKKNVLKQNKTSTHVSGFKKQLAASKNNFANMQFENNVILGIEKLRIQRNISLWMNWAQKVKKSHSHWLARSSVAYVENLNRAFPFLALYYTTENQVKTY